MMRFEQVVVLGATSFDEEIRRVIAPLSRHEVVYFKDLDSAANYSSSNCDALLVSLRSAVSQSLLQRLPSLRYVGVLGSSFEAIDLEACQSRSIVVTSVLGYCDFETAEFCLSQLLMLARGLGPHQWQEIPRTLAGKVLGIVGMGAVGQQLARLALAMRMEVVYYSRKKCESSELNDARFLELNELLRSSEVISLHVPANTRIFSAEHFQLIPINRILVNICMGSLYEESELLQWLDRKKGTVILDSLSALYHPKARTHCRAIVGKKRAHVTQESDARRLKLFVENICSYLRSRSA